MSTNTGICDLIKSTLHDLYFSSWVVKYNNGVFETQDSNDRHANFDEPDVRSCLHSAHGFVKLLESKLGITTREAQRREKEKL